MSSVADQLFSELDALPAPELAKPVLKRGVNYSHTAMIDLIISRPGVSQNEIALYFGYTPSWISTIMASDAFQTALAARREQIVDPLLKATLEEQARGLYLRSMEILRQKLNCDAANVPDQLALQTFAQSARALGYGARPPAPPPSDDLSQALVRHADNLTNLLRREKARVRAEEIIDVQASVPQAQPS